MIEVLQKRRRDFWEQCLKYLRYVLNDHFVLFLLVFLGFLALQYRALLQEVEKHVGLVLLGVGLFSILLLPMGSIATYIERADKHFLLAKEEELKSWVKATSRRSYLVWATFQSIGSLLLFPIFLALKWPVLGFIGYLFLILLGKYLLFQKKEARLLTETGLAWELAIAHEEARKQRILRFFALFTNVKGLSTSVKRRKYLDLFLTWLPKKKSHTWENLYLRSYLRNGELFGLTIRLLLLSVVVLGSVSQGFIAAIMALLFQYLLLFQLTALYQAYDYQYLTRLFPLEQTDKVRGARNLIQTIGAASLFIELIVGMIFLEQKESLLLLLGGTLVLQLFHLPYRLKRLVDE
ncbi:ABC transporter permease [Streptococcus himalayensis]|uniref:Multidrug ABC transporter permease n=1 Tax=Streptococcus himalayensis TaxID=1888195 RepID=A0A917A6B3_9STRE|nr:ABC transporter permease [Streptococcus himalayensis]GGE30844.1 multidrug ABC transporter permease [Streptococcus himalayensis]